MRYFIPFCVLFFCISCHNSKRDVARVPFVEVNDEYLYLDEIQSIVPKNLSADDSASVADSYVQNWVTNVLLYAHASKNIENKAEIEELTEAYRQSLIIHQYKQNILKERFNNDISEVELQNFYEKNKDKFKLTGSVVKGIFVKVPIHAPKLEFLVQNLQNYNKNSLENIEKYNLQNATEYEYFGDRWVSLVDILKKIPLGIENQSQIPLDQAFVSFKDSAHYYLLRTLDRRKPDDIEPYETAKDKIRLILSNQRKTDFIKDFEKNLYDEALKKNKIKYFSPEEND